MSDYCQQSHQPRPTRQTRRLTFLASHRDVDITYGGGGANHRVRYEVLDGLEEPNVRQASLVRLRRALLRPATSPPAPPSRDFVASICPSSCWRRALQPGPSPWPSSPR